MSIVIFDKRKLKESLNKWLLTIGSVVRVRAGEPIYVGCKNFNTSYSRFIFHSREEYARFACYVNPEEVDHNHSREELEISLV